MKNVSLICIVLCWIGNKNVLAQNNTINRVYSFLPYNTSIFNSIVVTDSCYYITGIVADSVWPFKTGALFVKTDLDGNPLIIKGLTDTINEYETWYQDLSSDNNGNLVTHGYNYAKDTNVLFFIKYDNEGNILTLNDFRVDPDSEFEIPFDMVKYGNDLYMQCVAVAHPDGKADLWVIKLNKNGIPQFSKLASNTVNLTSLNRITTTHDGGFIVGGLGSNQNIVSKNIKMQIVLTKLDSLGNRKWEYLSPENEDWFGTLGGLVVNENSEIVFGTAKGTAIPINSSSEYFVWDWCIAKMDSNKNILWRTYFRPPPDSISDGDRHLWNLISLQNQNGYVAVGQNFTPSRWYGWIVKVAENGDSLWMRNYNFDGLNIIYELKDIVEDLDGNLVMVGEYRNISGGDVGQKAWLLKVDQYGCLVPGCQLVSIEDIHSENVNLLLYPNPVNDFLSFCCSFSPELKNLTYSISDIQGHVIFNSHLTNGATVIYPVENMNPGTYLLQIICKNQIVKTEKFIVTH